MNLLKQQLGFFFYGLIFWFPIAVTFFVASVIFAGIDSKVRTGLGIVFPHRYFFTGLGFLLALFIIYLSGLLLKKTSIARVLAKIPILGIPFAVSGGGAMSLGRLLGLRPCLFLYTPTCPSYGWIMSQEPARSFGEDDYLLVNVYYPNVPTILTGQIYPVRKEAIIVLGNTSREVLDLLLYSLRSPESLKMVPWDNESVEHFKERVARFGLTPVVHTSKERL